MTGDQPQTTSFTDRCHFSETGWAVWERNKEGQSRCTCVETTKPLECETDDD